MGALASGVLALALAAPNAVEAGSHGFGGGSGGGFRNSGGFGGFGGGFFGSGAGFFGSGSVNGFMGFGPTSPPHQVPFTLSPGPGAFHNSNRFFFHSGFPGHRPFPHRFGNPFFNPFFNRSFCCFANWNGGGGWGWGGWNTADTWEALDYVTAPYAPAPAPPANLPPPQPNFQPHVITIPPATANAPGSNTTGSNATGSDTTGSNATAEPAATGSNAGTTAGANALETDGVTAGAGTPAVPPSPSGATPSSNAMRSAAPAAAGQVVISRPGQPDQVLETAAQPSQ